MTPSVVVFDIGGVLVDWQPHLARSEALGAEQAAHAFSDRAGVAPQDCVFVDDGLHNVDGARAIGMDGIHFTSPDALEQGLSKRGLL